MGIYLIDDSLGSLLTGINFKIILEIKNENRVVDSLFGRLPCRRLQWRARRRSGGKTLRRSRGEIASTSSGEQLPGENPPPLHGKSALLRKLLLQWWHVS